MYAIIDYMAKRLRVSKQGPILELLTCRINVAGLPAKGVKLTRKSRRQYSEFRYVSELKGRMNGGNLPMLCLVTDLSEESNAS